jgi:hypothetical protein
VSENVDADGSALRADEHVVFDRVLASEIVGAVDAAFGGFESFSLRVLLNLSAPVLDRDGALRDHVIDVSGMIMPGAGDLADRRHQHSSRDLRGSSTQSDVIAEAVLPERDHGPVSSDASGDDGGGANRRDAYGS